MLKTVLVVAAAALVGVGAGTGLAEVSGASDDGATGPWAAPTTTASPARSPTTSTPSTTRSTPTP